MKKVISLILFAVMMFVCSGSIAESPDLKPEDFTLDLTRSHVPAIDLIGADTFANKQVDKVTKDGSVYSVVSGDAVLSLDLTDFPTVLCYTQDLYVSLDAYLRCSQPYELLEQLVDNQVNFYLIDFETGLYVVLYQQTGDIASNLIGNLSTLPEDNRQSIAAYLGADSLLEAGGIIWAFAKDTPLVTIYNSRYFVVEFGGTDDADADLEDTLAMLGHLALE